MVPRVGLEPTPLSGPDFESGVATDYTTEAEAQWLAQGPDYHMTKARFGVRCDNEGVLSSSIPRNTSLHADVQDP